MNKKFNAEDKIELGLYHYAAEYYHLKYRFLPKKVRIHILFFYITVTVKDPWHVIRLYKSTGIPEINPDNESLWRPVHVNILDCSDIQRYNAMKKEITTYRDLDKTFDLTLKTHWINHFINGNEIIQPLAFKNIFCIFVKIII